MTMQTEYQNNAMERSEIAAARAAGASEGSCGRLSRGAEQIKALVEDKPSRSLLLTCLVGVGCGLILARVLGPSPSRSSFDPASAERFGRRMLDRIEQSMPEAFRGRFTS